jgi:hypothetical protein
MQARKIQPTTTVSARGEIAAGLSRMSYWDGFAALLDFTAPPLELEILPPGAPTSIGMTRTGQALRAAMAVYERTRS